MNTPGIRRGPNSARNDARSIVVARDRRINKFAANHSAKRRAAGAGRKGDDFSCKSQSAARPDKGPIKRTAFLPLRVPRSASFAHLLPAVRFSFSHRAPTLFVSRSSPPRSSLGLPPVPLCHRVSVLALFLSRPEYLSFLHTLAIIIQTLMTNRKSTAVRRPQYYPR